MASLLEEAAQYGEVWIKHRDGQMFIIKPQKRQGVPLDVKGVRLNLSRAEIMQSIEEGRRRF
ncbi:MAG: prevent-host-death protein [Chloroflexota bacterium]